MRFPVSLAPHEAWDVRVDVVVSLEGEVRPTDLVELRFWTERSRVQASLEAWSMKLPRLTTDWDVLRHSFDQSVADLAAPSRLRGARPRSAPRSGHAMVHDRLRPRHRHHELSRRWFWGPSSRSAPSGRSPSSSRRSTTPRSTPSRARSSTSFRSGRAAENWFSRYYGTVDATPLYLVLLSEVWRWTGDHALARTGYASPPSPHSSGSTATATVTGTASSNTTAIERSRESVLEGLGRLAALPRRPYRGAADRARGGPGIRLRREAQARRARPRGPGGTSSSRHAWSARRRSLPSGSTPPTGWTTAAATTRSRSTARSGVWTRSARTSVTCSGAGSSRPSARRRSWTP